MEKNLDIPLVTSHALGELDPAQTALLRLTHSRPGDMRALEEEAAEIAGIANLLKGVWPTAPENLRLTDAQRTRILETASTPISRKTATLEPSRKAYDRKPGMMATIFTLSAAAALVALLLVVKISGDSASGDVVDAEEAGGELIAPKFKVHQAKESAKSVDSKSLAQRVPNPQPMAKEVPLPDAVLPTPKGIATQNNSAKPAPIKDLVAPLRGPVAPPPGTEAPKSFAAPK
jgi:hypothetical protein